MYSTVGKTIHFRAQTGSSSTRIMSRGYGGKGTFPKEQLKIEPLISEQAKTLEVRARDTYARLLNAETFEEAVVVQKQLQKIVSDYGDLTKKISKAHEYPFGRLFQDVAKRMLPSDVFGIILSETTALLTDKPELPPPLSDRMTRRANRKLTGACWKAQLADGGDHLHEKDIDEITALLGKGTNRKYIARLFNVSNKRITRIKNKAT